MISKEKAKKLHEIADSLEEWDKYNEKVTNSSEWSTPTAKQIIRKAMTLLVDNLALLNECKNKYGYFNPLTQCFMAIEQAASWPETKDLADCQSWTRDFTERHLWGGEKRSLADECVRYANKVARETEQGTDKKIYKGEEAWQKFEEKLSEFGSLEIPLYPFKAGKIKYWNLTGKSNISKYGAYRFSQEDSAIIKNTVGSILNVSTLRAYLSAECNVQNPDNYSWKDILAALEHKLKTKTISETQPDTKREQEGVIEPKPPEILQNILWVKKYGRKYWKLIAVSVIILGIYFDLKFNFHALVFNVLRNKTTSSSGRTELYPRTKKRVYDISERIEEEKLNPWRFINIDRMSPVTMHDGRVISYKGVMFTGAPRLIFWSDDFIPPFIEDAIVQVFDKTIEECQENDLEPKPYIDEANRLLLGFILHIYARMADIDQKLCSTANSKKAGQKDTSLEVKKMQECLKEHYDAALLLASKGKNTN